MRVAAKGWISDVDAPRRSVFEMSTIYGDREEHTNRWECRLEPEPNGTLVTESLRTSRLPVPLKLLGPFLGLRVAADQGPDGPDP